MNGNFLNHKKNPLIVITGGPRVKAVTLLAFYSRADFIEIIEPGHPLVSYPQTQKPTIICCDPIILSSCSTDQNNSLFLYLRPLTLWIIIPMWVVRNLTWSISLFLLYSCFSSHWNIPTSFTMVCYHISTCI